MVLSCNPATGAPVRLENQAPSAITTIGPQEFLVDFGRVAFGNLRLTPPTDATNRIRVRFGEALAGGRVDWNPPGSVRYSEVTLPLAGIKSVVVAPPADKRNTQQGGEIPPAVLTPSEWGVITPFRWVEIAGWPGKLGETQMVRQAAFSATWDDQAASFECSDKRLNRIWELCKYSIKATTFAGIYVDGDRERIPYEADAYLNQLSHYYTDGKPQIARDTFDHLMAHPTWPTEWAYHMIFIAYADWRWTGDTNWLAAHYDALESKLLSDRAGSDGLITSTPGQIKQGDLVDWPLKERDGYVFTSVNTVVNSFYLRSLTLMAEMANALHKDREAAAFLVRESAARSAFQEKLFDATRGIYRDGLGADHASLHANLFPLAFGLVPLEHRASVTDFCVKRGMGCSVYAAQYLLEGLFENNAVAKALTLMTASNDRSWSHMVKSGTTITWEAWDQKYKPNQDWNHAWGAAPANLLPRFVLGARPLSPGWRRALICPNPGSLKSAGGKIPTPLGPLLLSWQNESEFRIALTLPPGMKAVLELPAGENAKGLFSGTQPVRAHRTGLRWVTDEDVSGTVSIEVK